MNVDNIISLNSDHGRRRGKEGGDKKNTYFHCPLGYINLHQRARLIGAWIHNDCRTSRHRGGQPRRPNISHTDDGKDSSSCSGGDSREGP